MQAYVQRRLQPCTFKTKISDVEYNMYLINNALIDYVKHKKHFVLF